MVGMLAIVQGTNNSTGLCELEAQKDQTKREELGRELVTSHDLFLCIYIYIHIYITAQTGTLKAAWIELSS